MLSKDITIGFIYRGLLTLLATVAATGGVCAMPNTVIHANHNWSDKYFYLCPTDEEQVLYIDWMSGEEEWTKTKMTWHLTAEDAENDTNAFRTHTNKKLSNCRAHITREMINPTGEEATKEITVYARIENTETGEVEINEAKVRDVYVPKPDISDVEICKGKSLPDDIISKTLTLNYNWYEYETGAALKFADYLLAGGKPVGEYKYIVQTKNNKEGCKSEEVYVTLTIKDKETPETAFAVAYMPSDIKNGKYPDLQTQSQKTNGRPAAESGGADCELIWYDGEGNKAEGLDGVTPKVKEQSGIETYMVSVSQDCGCGESDKKNILVMIYTMPKPDVVGASICKDGGADTTITISTKINTADNTETKEKYRIEVSDGEDFANILFAGAKGEDGDIEINIGRAEAGKTPIYVRQMDDDGNAGTPTIAYIDIIETQPPTLTKTEHGFCLAEQTTIDLAQFATEEKTEWTGDSPLFAEAGTKTFYARNYKTIPQTNKVCYSEAETLRVSAETINATISGPTEICPEAAETISANIEASGAYTTNWTTAVSNMTATTEGDEVAVVYSGDGEGICIIIAEVTGQVCKKDLVHTVKGIKGMAKGTISLTNSVGGTNTYNVGEEIEFATCEGGATLSTNLEATDANYSLMSYRENIETGSMSDGRSVVEIPTNGKYKLVYTNKCKTEIDFAVSKAIVEEPPLANKTFEVCVSDGAKEVDLEELTGFDHIIWEADGRELVDGKVTIPDIEYKQIDATGYFDIITEDGKYERCFSETVSFAVKGEKIVASITGDAETCSGMGEAKVDVTTTERDYTITWSADNDDDIQRGETKEQVIIKTNGGSTTATATIQTKVCKTKLSHTLTQIEGKAEGSIYITNADEGRNTYSADEAIDILTCDGTATINTRLATTDDTYTLWRGDARVSRGDFDNGEAVINIEQEGEYRIEYANKCQTAVSINIRKKNMASPTMLKTSETVCINQGDAEIDLGTFAAERNIIWTENGNALSNTNISVNQTGERMFEARLYYNIVYENGVTSVCTGEAKEVTVNAEALTADIVAVSSVCPGESATLTAEINSNAIYFINWNCTPQIATTGATNSKDFTVTANGYDINATLTVSTTACTATATHTITEGKGITKGSITFAQEDGRLKTFKAEDEPMFTSCGTDFVATISLDRTAEEYTVTSPVGESTQGSKAISDDIEISDYREGTYTIEYINKCPTKAMFTVENLRPRPKFSTKNINTCEGNSPIIEVSNIDAYEAEWIKDGETTGRKGRSITLSNITHADEGKYTILMRTDGCTFNTNETAQVRVYDQPELSAKASRDTVCTGSIVTITLTHSPQYQTTTYQWAGSADLLSPLGSDVMSVKPSTSGQHTYTATMTSGDCQTRTASITIHCDPVIEGALDADPSLCSGVETTIDASPFNADEYLWTSTDQSANAQATPRITAIPSAPQTEYTVWMRRGECEKTVRHTLYVGKTPEITSIDSIAPGSILITTDRDADELTFCIDGDKCDNSNTKEGLTFGRHKVSVRDDAGCHTDTIVNILEPIMTVPIVFTPDGNGIYDKIGIPKEYAQYASTEMQIFDRFGKLLVTLRGDANTEWDGTYNGNKMPSTDYWYIISVHELRKYFTGHFTLLRGE